MKYVDAPLLRVNKSEYRSPPNGVLYDARITADVAYAFLENALGEERVRAHLPLRVAQVDEVWVVEGSMALKDAAGGVFHLELSRADGRILVFQQQL